MRSLSKRSRDDAHLGGARGLASALSLAFLLLFAGCSLVTGFDDFYVDWSGDGDADGDSDGDTDTDGDTDGDDEPGPVRVVLSVLECLEGAEGCICHREPEGGVFCSTDPEFGPGGAMPIREPVHITVEASSEMPLQGLRVAVDGALIVEDEAPPGSETFAWEGMFWDLTVPPDWVRISEGDYVIRAEVWDAGERFGSDERLLHVAAACDPEPTLFGPATGAVRVAMGPEGGAVAWPQDDAVQVAFLEADGSIAPYSASIDMGRRVFEVDVARMPGSPGFVLAYRIPGESAVDLIEWQGITDTGGVTAETGRIVGTGDGVRSPTLATGERGVGLAWQSPREGDIRFTEIGSAYSGGHRILTAPVAGTTDHSPTLAWARDHYVFAYLRSLSIGDSDSLRAGAFDPTDPSSMEVLSIRVETDRLGEPAVAWAGDNGALVWGRQGTVRFAGLGLSDVGDLIVTGPGDLATGLSAPLHVGLASGGGVVAATATDNTGWLYLAMYDAGGIVVDPTPLVDAVFRDGAPSLAWTEAGFGIALAVEDEGLQAVWLRPLICEE